MDQSSETHPGPRPRRAAGRTRIARLLASLALLALGITVAGCGGGMSTESALPDPHPATATEVGGTPVAVAVGAGGVWVADNSGSRVLALDSTNGHPTGKPLAVAAGPEAMAFGEGGVWVVSGDGTVTRIDPETGKAQEAPAKVADPGGIAAGEGAVWVTSHAKGTVTRIDPMTLRVVGDPIPVGAGPTDIAVGAGAAWVANTDDGTVTRVDGADAEPSDPIAVADYQVLGLCFGEDGVWVAKTDDRLARTIEVARIDPASSKLDDETAPVTAAIPVRLAAGEGGVWTTLVGGIRLPDSKPRPGQVALVDPADPGSPAELLRAGEGPAGIAVGEGAVWVADSGSGTVTRIGL
jgi:streptogramin lyase